MGQTLIPPGVYQVWIIESKERRTKSGTGTYLSLTLEITDGAHKWRKLWAIINLTNPSAFAVSKGKEELASICRATGKTAAADSQELHEVLVLVTVSIDGQWNRITKWAAVRTVPQTPRLAPQTPRLAPRRCRNTPL